MTDRNNSDRRCAALKSELLAAEDKGALLREDISDLSGETGEAREARLRAIFEKSPTLQGEYGSIEAYLSYKLAVDTGRVGGVNRMSAPPVVVVDGAAELVSSTDDQLRSRFNESKDLKVEFGRDGIDSYIAYVRAAAAGQIKMS